MRGEAFFCGFFSVFFSGFFFTTAVVDETCVAGDFTCWLSSPGDMGSILGA